MSEHYKDESWTSATTTPFRNLPELHPEEVWSADSPSRNLPELHPVEIRSLDSSKKKNQWYPYTIYLL